MTNNLERFPAPVLPTVWNRAYQYALGISNSWMLQKFAQNPMPNGQSYAPGYNPPLGFNTFANSIALHQSVRESFPWNSSPASNL
jgi:hypothetical protein